jgi:DNA primase
LTIDEMTEFLDQIGIEVIDVRGSELKAKCPGHFERTGKDDRNPSWSINAETGVHRCWSCDFKGTLRFLVAYTSGIDIDEVDEQLDKINGADTHWLSNRLAKVDEKPEQGALPEPIEESEMSLFVEVPIPYLKSRGITPSAAKFYGLLYNAKKDCWIIPIREPRTNALWGWQEKGARGRYFNNHPQGVKKGLSLFGYHEKQLLSKQSNDDLKTILVESPLDVARLASVGYMGGVASYGAYLTKHQLDLLAEERYLYIALDNDDAGHMAAMEIKKWADARNKPVWFFNYDQTDQKDVGGMSKDEIKNGIDNARLSLRKGALAK